VKDTLHFSPQSLKSERRKVFCYRLQDRVRPVKSIFSGKYFLQHLLNRFYTQNRLCFSCKTHFQASTHAFNAEKKFFAVINTGVDSKKLIFSSRHAWSDQKMLLAGLNKRCVELLSIFCYAMLLY
jgi:hypothetical protein